MIFKNLVALFFFFVLNAVLAQQLNCNNKWFEGDGTQYGGVAGGAGGNCGLPVASGDFYHAAMNQVQYDSSGACGSCVRILGPKGEIKLKIVDRCPECKPGDIDMTTDAFLQLAELKDGRIPIRWQFVPCEVEGDIQILYASGTGSYYFKAQLRNMSYAVSELAYQNSAGNYVPIHREEYNYFVNLAGIDEDKQQAGPYLLRITSSTGQVIELPAVSFENGGIVSLDTQFTAIEYPDCAGVVGGSAEIDQCGKCTGGTTGKMPNSSCKQDCIDYWNGTAYLDTCGKCVSGTTGGTPCGQDCHGDNGGLAFVDLCGRCAGGNTGIIPITNPEDCVTGIGDVKIEKDLNVFPNPFKEMLTVTCEGEFTYRLVSSLGLLVEAGQGTTETQIAERLPSGTYVLLLTTKEGVINQLVLKE